jgi:uncharacterized membrane protein YdjX (TVP38/TMEM64 family)
MIKNLLFPFLIVSAVIIIIFLCFNNIESFLSDVLNSVINKPALFVICSFAVLISDIILPVPSSIVMFTNGYVLGWFYGALLSIASLMISSFIGYYLGKFTSRGLKTKSDQRADQILEKYGTLAILMSRGIPILSESICIVCGYNRMPLKRYLTYNLIGFIPLSLLYAFCGSMGYEKNVFLLSFVFSLFIALAFWFYGKSLAAKTLSGR